MTPRALVDSNVVIAALVGAHEHHAPSLALFTRNDPSVFAIAAQSYAEAYCALTRRGEHAPFRFTSDEAWAALERLAAITTLAGLTPAQTFDTVRAYARSGGVGARLYDRLIGEVAVQNGLTIVVTWNTGHMRGLFPTLDVRTPEGFAPT